MTSDRLNAISIIILGLALTLNIDSTYNRINQLQKQVDLHEEAIVLEKDSIKSLFEIIQHQKEIKNHE